MTIELIMNLYIKMNLSGSVKRPKLKLQFFSIAIKMYELNDNRINNEITYKD